MIMKKILLLLIFITSYVVAQPSLTTGNLTVKGKATINRGLVLPDSTPISQVVGMLYRDVDTIYIVTSTGTRKVYPQTTGEGTVDGLNRYGSNALSPFVFNQDFTPLVSGSSGQGIGTTTRPWKWGFFNWGYGLAWMGTVYGNYLKVLSNPSANFINYLPLSNGVLVNNKVDPLSISNTGYISMTRVSTFDSGYVNPGMYNRWEAKTDSLAKASTTGTSLVRNNLGKLNRVRTLVEGAGITLTNTDSTVTIVGTGAGASQTLNNLTSPTSINQHLIPSTATKTLGTLSASWYDLYLGRSLWFRDVNEGRGIALVPHYTLGKGTEDSIIVPDSTGTMVIGGSYPVENVDGFIELDQFVKYGSDEIGVGDSCDVSNDLIEYTGYSIVAAITTLQHGSGFALGITSEIESPEGAPQRVIFRSITQGSFGANFYYQILYKRN
jgi:hypothetical protein